MVVESLIIILNLKFHALESKQGFGAFRYCPIRKVYAW